MHDIVVPCRMEPCKAIGLLERELWCPCDYRKVPAVVGYYLCRCGFVITISEEDLNWLKQGSMAEFG